MYTQAYVANRAVTTGMRSNFSYLLAMQLFMFSLVCLAAPGEFVATEATTTETGGVQLLDAQFSIHLSAGAREAMENGVPLTLELQVQLVKEHKWFWDTVEAEHMLVRQLQYYALTRSYQLRDTATDSVVNYTRLEDALEAAGRINRLLLRSMPLEEGGKYAVRLRGSLDLDALPNPVRLLAYVDSDWEMTSEWFSWPVER